MTPQLLTHLPHRMVHLHGEWYRYFSGTSYLGMGHDATFKAALLEGMEQYGTAFGSSRVNLLQLAIYEEAEELLARWTTAPAALTCSSGLLAGQIVSRFLESSHLNATYFFAPKTHPANWNSQYQAATISIKNWEENIIEYVENAESKSVIIIANAVDSFACEPQNFDFISHLPTNKNTIVVIDDSHGIGVIGEEGAGIFGQINCPNHVKLVVVASMNKALGVPGGMILSDKETIQDIRQSPFWIGASPIVPAYLYAFVHAQDTYTQARARLQQNIQLFTENTSHLSQFDYLPHYPVFKSKENALYEKLITHRIMPYHFMYPSQSEKAVTRLVISSLHTEEDIVFLVDVLKK